MKNKNKNKMHLWKNGLIPCLTNLTLSILRLTQNGWYAADDIFKIIVSNENVCKWFKFHWILFLRVSGIEALVLVITTKSIDAYTFWSNCLIVEKIPTFTFRVNPRCVLQDIFDRYKYHCSWCHQHPWCKMGIPNWPLPSMRMDFQRSWKRTS